MRIGPWTFDPAGQSLQRGKQAVRLEHRAARLLKLLVGRAGEVVSREEIVDAIWNGRTLSDNSVAVVVSDLRRVLGDDARAPSFIETVPKRGYRMPRALTKQRSSSSGQPPAAPGELARLVAWYAMLLLLLIAGSVAAVRSWQDTPRRIVVTINDVRNETGSDAHDRTASAITAIGTAFLSRSSAPVLVRNRWDFDAEDPSRGLYEDFGPDARVYHISSTIVMESSMPRLVMVANDPRTNEVIWSSEAELTNQAIGTIVRNGLDEFLVETGLQEPDD